MLFRSAARNDFITYWLPALSKKPYVALRFLPQAVYERAAELRVEPKPDVVTRAMMLFRGVGEGEVLLWADASTCGDCRLGSRRRCQGFRRAGHESVQGIRMGRH